MLKISQQGVISDYIQITGEETVNIMVNVTDLSLSLKVPVNIRATKYIYGTKTYTYDSTNRLTSIMRGVLEEDRFSYDGVGNRLTDIANNSYAYNNGNELLNYDGVSFQYDANGNMVSKTDSSGTTSYVYDSENRLVQINTQPVTGNPQLMTYKYDPFGRRIEKNVNGIITRYVYDREDILFELDGGGNIVTEFVHGPGIDEPIAMIKGGQTYYYHADGLGSIIAITDSAGRVVQRYEYDSFGAITYIQDPNFVQPYTYTGREYDQESGLYYYRARYYDAKVGRFLQQDPIGFWGGVNFYSYVGNRPLTWIDPWGLYLGQMPPPPPGYDPATWQTGQWDNGNWYVKSPDDGRIYTAHPEDLGHWRHWDTQGPGGDEGPWPPNPGKRRPNQKKLGQNQCETDPSGDAPEWTPPTPPIPFMPLEPIGPIPPPFRIPPIRIPVPVFP